MLVNIIIMSTKNPKCENKTQNPNLEIQVNKTKIKK